MDVNTYDRELIDRAEHKGQGLPMSGVQLHQEAEICRGARED